uniref:Putative secreted protein n=1 Tax=Anopheles marajoara TaxID=58244 RepID=A0A2M4CFW6_9DIPT
MWSSTSLRVCVCVCVGGGHGFNSFIFDLQPARPPTNHVVRGVIVIHGSFRMAPHFADVNVVAVHPL